MICYTTNCEVVAKRFSRNEFKKRLTYQVWNHDAESVKRPGVLASGSASKRQKITACLSGCGQSGGNTTAKVSKPVWAAHGTQQL